MITINGKAYTIWHLLGAVVAVLGMIAATIGYGGTIATSVADVAWKTRHGHQNDVDAIYAAIAAEVARLDGEISDGIMETSDEVADFRNEWKCEDYRKELNELLAKRDARTITSQEEDRVRVLLQKMGPVSQGGLNCAQYED